MARKKARWNIGTIVFLVLLIYVLINVLIFVGKEKLTVYKVTEDKISSTYSLNGIALRNEKLLKAEDDGYITYYTEEGKRVKKSGMLYVLDKNGKVQEEEISRRIPGSKAGFPSLNLSTPTKILKMSMT